MISIFERLFGFVDIITEECPLTHSEQYHQTLPFPRRLKNILDR